MVRTLTALGSLLVVAGGASAACFSYEDDPALCYECRGETSGAADAGGDVVTPSGCIPSENPGTSVGDECGVFVSVSAGSDGNAGTKDAPVATLTKAIALAGAGEKRVYLCAEQLEGAAKVPAGFTIFGGLGCATGWVYVGDATPTKLLGPADQIALVLEKGGGTTRLEDVHVIARDATKAGGSSIAALADGVTAELVRCTLEAGDAADGTSGEALAEAAAAGVDGSPGNEACSAGTVLGGNETPLLCGDVSSIGGNGGQGNANSAADGNDGAPGTTMNGGTSEKVSACADGVVGDAGPVGMPGPGGSGLGVLDKTGYKGVAGMEGAAGAPGQGGGGGGGARGGTGIGKCVDMTKAGGASGGSGASGGCGGAGGKPGGAGGASIALISLDAKLTFSSTKLTAKKGGNGGSGGAGQAGGAGGMNGGAGGGVPVTAGSLKPGCAGGPGGAGGSGGPGGNGAGGHSLGIAYTGAAPAMDGVMSTPGQAGTGGATADPMGQPGQAGTAAPILAFQ